MWSLVRWYFLLAILLLIPPFTPYGILLLFAGICVVCAVFILLGIAYVWKGAEGISRLYRY